jgi:RNA polymerase sigma factor (sigma-70 family)
MDSEAATSLRKSLSLDCKDKDQRINVLLEKLPGTVLESWEHRDRKKPLTQLVDEIRNKALSMVTTESKSDRQRRLKYHRIVHLEDLAKDDDESVDLPATGGSPEAFLVTQEFQTKVSECSSEAGLSPREREVLELRMANPELASIDIAETLNTTENNVNQLIHRMRKKLRPFRSSLEEAI